MRKRFLNAVLFATAFATATGTLVSCKDYDDDIASLQEQINAKATAADLTAQLSTLSNDLNSTKSSLTSELSTLKAQLEAVQKGNDATIAEVLESMKSQLAGVTASQEATKAELTKALEEKIAAMTKTVDSKVAAIDAALAKIDKLAADIKTANEAQLKVLAEQVDAMTAEVVKIVGHRLTSIALIPTAHVNGIASLELKNLVYRVQEVVKYEKNNPVFENHKDAEGSLLDHKNKVFKDKDGKEITPKVFIAGSDTAYYHISPAKGVRAEDIAQPQYVAIASTNTTRAVPVVESPIKGIGYTVKDGILAVAYAKNAAVWNKDTAHGDERYIAEKDADPYTEDFQMVSLQVPVTEANWTAEEKKVGDPVYVNSEYARVEETNYWPYLYNTGYDFKKEVSNAFADETWKETVVAKDKSGRGTEERYVHYHDSLCVFNSANREMVDYCADYNQPFDLTKKVGVCITTDEAHTTGHKALTADEVKAYGLKFLFDIAQAKYPQGDLKTDQQQFIKETETDGVFVSKVYDAANVGESSTALGREPIIRVRLVDTKNNNALIALRYVKIRWVEQTKVNEQEIPALDLGENFVACAPMYKQLFTKSMNEDVYNQVKVLNNDGTTSTSISKKDFHNLYTNVKVLSLTKDGTVIYDAEKNLSGDPKKAVKLTLTPANAAPEKDVVLTALGSADVVADKVFEPGKDKLVENGDEAMDGANIVFGYLVDNLTNAESGNDNNTYNLIWAMDEAAVGTVSTKGSEFVLRVEYSSDDAAYGKVYQEFKQVIKTPTQNFNYQGIYWRNQQGNGTFNVNPLAYYSKWDGEIEAIKHADETENFADMKDWSHVEADLVNGWVSTVGDEKPVHLGEYIQYIKGCANVKFVFDESRFKNYSYLNGYTVDPTGTQLWKVGVDKKTGKLTGTPKTITTDTEKGYLNENQEETSKYRIKDEAIVDYLAGDTPSWYDVEGTKEYDPTKELAATINNHLYTTEATNGLDAKSKPVADKNNLPWITDAYALNGVNMGANGIQYTPFDQMGFIADEKYNDTDAAYSIIRLHEADNYNGTDAAKALIGKDVPVNLRVLYNKYNQVDEQIFDVHFIEPLTINGGDLGHFQDIVYDGSFLALDEKFGFTDYVGYAVAPNTYTLKKGEKEAPAKNKFQHSLYDYYCVKSVIFDEENTTTSLFKNGSTIRHKEGYTEGKLPGDNTTLKMVVKDGDTYKPVDKNPTHLGYYNDKGTPMSEDYQLFVNVSVDYKWGVMSKNSLPIWVKVSDSDDVNDKK